MTNHTPKMSVPECSGYLEQHLGNELQWTLRAATEWHVQNSLKLCVGGYEVQVFAMDSTFLHARTLFEFLTQRSTSNHYGCDAFGLEPLPSDLYQNDWKQPLHAYMMHAQDRSMPRQLKSFDSSGNKHLNQMPVDFGREIVRLWKEFANAMRASSEPGIAGLAPTAENLLRDAVNNAAKVARSAIAVKHSEDQGRVIPAIVWEP